MKIPSNIATIAVIAIILIAGGLAIVLSIPRSPKPLPPPITTGVAASATHAVSASNTPLPTTLPLTPGTPLPAALVRVWNSMCVEGVPYTLLSVPPDARFALVQAQGQVPMTAIPLTGLTPIPSVIPTYSTPGFVGGTAGPLPTATTTPQAANGTALVPATGSNSGSLGVAPTQNSCTALGQLNGLQMIMCTGPEGAVFNFYVRQGNAAQLYQGMLWNCTAPSNTPVASVTALPALSSTPPPTLAPTTVPPTAQPTLPPPTAAPTNPPTIAPTSPPPATATP